MKAIRVTQTRLMDPFTQVKSAEHMAKIIQHKSNQGAQADLKMYKTSKIKYLLIHNSLFKNVIFLTKEYNLYLKILQKLRCLVAFQNRPSAPMTEIY